MSTNKPPRKSSIAAGILIALMGPPVVAEAQSWSFDLDFSGAANAAAALALDVPLGIFAVANLAYAGQGERAPILAGITGAWAVLGMVGGGCMVAEEKTRTVGGVTLAVATLAVGTVAWQLAVGEREEKATVGIARGADATGAGYPMAVVAGTF